MWRPIFHASAYSARKVRAYTHNVGQSPTVKPVDPASAHGDGETRVGEPLVNLGAWTPRSVSPTVARLPHR